MKKTGFLAMVFGLTLAMGAAGAAAEKVNSYSGVGVDLPVTEELQNTKGLVLPIMLGSLDRDDHVYGLGFYYEAMPAEEAVAILSKSASEVSEEEKQAVFDVQNLIGVLLASGLDREETFGFYSEYSGDRIPMDYEGAREVGSADGFTFYLVLAREDEDYLSSIGDEYAGEYLRYGEDLAEALESASFYEPVDPAKSWIGKKLEFETTDPDGNVVTSRELFSQNAITMLNCWGLWCPACVDEMEALAEIHTRLQEKDCGLVGLEWERNPDEETWRTVREEMEKWGTNYPNVLMPDSLEKQVMSFPTTFFVDREGVILCQPIFGAAVSRYEEVLDGLLADAE